MDIVGENVRKIRKLKGLSQKELAASSGMDASNLSKLERGEYTWTKDNLTPLAKSLGVTVADFFVTEARVPLLGPIRAGFESLEPNFGPRALISIDERLGRLVQLGEALFDAQTPKQIRTVRVSEKPVKKLPQRPTEPEW